MRLAYYAGASTAAAAACLLKAFHQRPNFYSATVYLSQSNACLLILTNLVLVVSCSFIYGLQRILYGPLRPIEMEQLSEKAWYAVLDTLLAMPSFREDVGGWLLAMFTLLLAGKVWGWIGEGRVDVLEQQPPANPRLFHLRLATSLLVSVIFDFWMLHFCVETVVADPRPSMMVIFTFEFAVLTVFSLFTLARYGLSVLQIRIEKQQTERAIEERKEEIKAERAAARQSETADGPSAPGDAPVDEPIEVDENELELPGWEEKRRYLFALEVLTDFVKLLIYIVFFTVSITFNGLPMHIMRDVYMTFASFTKRVSDFIAYRKATSDMNSRYPDATTEEIRGDSCIVCRETMVAWEQPGAQQEPQPAVDQPAAAAAVPARRRDEGLRAKKLPCGHILHLRCLKAWLERQQVCPTCRRPVVTAEASGEPAQGAAGGGANAAAGQPPRPARRQGRARIFNLGPVRIGFLNGPGDQLGNIVRQMQNPNAAPGANAAPQQPPVQGPNHLGLQEPYAVDGLGHDNGLSNRGVDAGGRLSTPIQIQLMQMEQRLLQDAHNLNLEQRQLATLHAMESELARLRTFHIPAHQPVGTGTAAQRVNVQAVPLPQMHAPLWGMNGNLRPAQANVTPRPEVLHGSAGQSMSSGHDSLPEGLVLPDGWSLMPLQRASGGSTATETRDATRQSDATVVPDASVAVAQDRTPAPAAFLAAAPEGATGQAGEASSLPGDGDVAEVPSPVVPTDENGSPLFISTSAGNTHQNATQTQIEAGGPVSPVIGLDGTGQQADAPAVASPTGQASPWSAGDWGFANQPQPDHTGTVPEPASTTSHATNDKGKGRAAEVEDAPDDSDI